MKRQKQWSPAQVKRLERRLGKALAKPQRLRVLGESRRTRARHWGARRAKCFYWWHAGRVAGLLGRFR